MTKSQRAHYNLCISQGTCHALAEMFALGQPPQSNTDREFLMGTENGRQFEHSPEMGDHHAALAREAGVDITGKVYKAGLAEYPGDPRAWVSGRGDVLRILNERGWGCEGAVNVPVTNIAEPTGGGLSPDLVEAEVQDILETVPDPAFVDVQDLREQVIERRKPYWVE